MSWKTSLFGLLAAIGAAVLAGLATGIIDANDLPKWVRGVAALMSVIGTAGTGFFARDNDVTSEQVAASKVDAAKITKGALIVVAFCLLAIFFAGCAVNRQYATTTVTNPTNGLVTVTVARSSTLAFGDAKNVIEKTRASAGKTSSVGASGINEDVNSSGLATNLQAVTGLLNALKP